MAGAGKYQHLQKYKGSLYGQADYSGIEYDFETPDNMVVSSPGGVSGIQHHYTKGMYSDASSYSDIYGGEPPAYPAAEFGSLYEQGLGSSFTQNDYAKPTDLPGRGYTQNQTQTRRDNFEIIPMPDTHPNSKTSPSSSGVTPLTENFATDDGGRKAINPIVLFGILLLLYIAIDFWQNASKSFIITNFHSGQEMTWKTYAIYGAVFTFLLIVLVNVSDITFHV